MEDVKRSQKSWTEVVRFILSTDDPFTATDVQLATGEELYEVTGYLIDMAQVGMVHRVNELESIARQQIVYRRGSNPRQFRGKHGIISQTEAREYSHPSKRKAISAPAVIDHQLATLAFEDQASRPKIVSLARYRSKLTSRIAELEERNRELVDELTAVCFEHEVCLEGIEEIKRDWERRAERRNRESEGRRRLGSGDSRERGKIIPFPTKPPKGE